MDFVDTAELTKKITNASSPRKQGTVKQQMKLVEMVKEGVYKMINKFEEVIGPEQEYATWD